MSDKVLTLQLGCKGPRKVIVEYEITGKHVRQMSTSPEEWPEVEIESLTIENDEGVQEDANLVYGVCEILAAGSCQHPNCPLRKLEMRLYDMDVEAANDAAAEYVYESMQDRIDSGFYDY